LDSQGDILVEGNLGLVLNDRNTETTTQLAIFLTSSWFFVTDKVMR
jgi:hypothetical protein